MNAKTKRLALALATVCVLGALGASSASANYRIAASSGTISGSQPAEAPHVLTTNVGNWICSSATFTGSQATETASTLTITPTYAGCKLAGVKVNVTFAGGCDWRFETPATLETDVTTANLETCPTGAGHVLVKDTSGLGCEITFKPQTVSHVVFTNETSATPKKAVSANFTMSGIHYTWTAGCPNAGGKAGTATNGTYSGTVTFTAKDTNGNPTDFEVT